MVAALGAGAIRELAARVGIVPTKKLGQNFVIDPNTVRYIVEQSRVNPDSHVVEIGPGLGSLTLRLLEVVSHVTAVEIDGRLSDQLPVTVRENCPEFLGKLTVINRDALEIHAGEINPAPSDLIANLPYNVAVPVLLHFLAEIPELTGVLVMVQKEVADRLCAGPGSRVYGIPSVKIQWFGKAEAAGNIGKNVFWPAPNVDSGLVRVHVTHPYLHLENQRGWIFQVVDAAFAHRRKTLRAGMADFVGTANAAERALINAGIDPGARAETLGLDAFVRLAASISEQRN
ncbi:MAG: 16S rRNA (adenine(1518)-N(6)/adenine(1519)-N(6))-dimethyltransferase RsmA [Candidatus Nanopelagicales bacterium]